MADGFVVPTAPFDQLNMPKELATRLDGGAVDLSIGTPNDPPPEWAVAALAESGAEAGYPKSVGSPALLEATTRWLDRCFDVGIDPTHVGATVGTKEFVVTTPHYLHLRRPERDTLLLPAIAYPSYAVGAQIAGLRPVEVPLDANWRLDLSAIDPADAARSVALWVNSPGNPAGGVDDLAAAAEWGRAHDVIVLSDECYLEFHWAEPAAGRRRSGHTILEHGLDGVLALHSLSKRSNWAGGRCGSYAGDPALVQFLAEVRRHAGHIVPAPVQHASALLLDDDDHVDLQRDRYEQRLRFMIEVLDAAGIAASMPEGGFYLWLTAPDGDAWRLTNWLAEHGGVVGVPGEFYGATGAANLRLALVQSMERLALVADRLHGLTYPS